MFAVTNKNKEKVVMYYKIALDKRNLKGSNKKK